jgi:hypothetical protein
MFSAHKSSNLNRNRHFFTDFWANLFCKFAYNILPWCRGLVVSSPPAAEETGAMDREIESRQGKWRGFFLKKRNILPWCRGLVVWSPPATEETGAMGREIESIEGIKR